MFIKKRFFSMFQNEEADMKNRFPVRTVFLLAAVIAFFALLVGCSGVQLRESITVEAGSPLPEARAFLVEDNAETEISYLTRAETAVPGSYEVTLLCKEKEYTAQVIVEDTVCPAGKTQDLTAYPHAIPAAEDFILEVTDVTNVTIRFAAEPDRTLAGEQIVTLVLTDASGNTTELTAVLTLIIDNEAPVLEGVSDKLLYIGDTVAYRAGVTVTDNMDESPVLTIDSGAVDLTRPGVYEVIYTAADKSGNTVSQTVTVTILEKKEEGAAILLCSADLDEVLRLSDRVITIYEGRITGEFDKHHLEKTEIGYYMTGSREEVHQ